MNNNNEGGKWFGLSLMTVILKSSPYDASAQCSEYAQQDT